MTPQERYLELLRKVLVNEIYLENDARMMYLAMGAVMGMRVDPDVHRNIAARRPDVIDNLRKSREVGSAWWIQSFRKADGTTASVNFRNYCDFNHSMIGARRMRNIEECLDVIRAENVPGDLAETGVWRGGAAVLMRAYLEAYEMPERVVWAADSFEGLPVPTHSADQGYDFSANVVPILAVSLDEVKQVFERYGLLDDRVRFLKGWFKDTLPGAPIEQLALLRLDGDLYESTWDALNGLYSKVSPGGFVLVDDYGDFPPCKKAVHEFREKFGITEPIQQVDWSGVFWRKGSRT